MMNSLLQAIPPQFRLLVKRLSYFILGTILTVFYAQLVHAQTSSNTLVQNPYSIETILAAVIGAIITIFFLRGMYLVLTYASQTYGFEEEEELSDAQEAKENNVLLYGAFGWIFLSALVIASYGWGWGFLYIGPIVCLLGPIVPIIAMNRDIEKYKAAIAEKNAARRSQTLY